MALLLSIFAMYGLIQASRAVKIPVFCNICLGNTEPWLAVGRLGSLGSPATPEMDSKRQGGLFNCCGRKQQPTTSPPEAQPSSATFR